MIASLRGTLVSKAVESIVVDVHGVGYQLSIPLSTYYKLPMLSQEVFLLVHTHVREDAIILFGFCSKEEKDLFELLLKVSKIGPKLALAILSSITSDEFYRAVAQGNIERIQAIPGIGKRMAERIILELKDRITSPPPEFTGFSSTEVSPSVLEDALAALLSLGYQRSVAEDILGRLIREHHTGSWSVQEFIKASLKRLGTNKAF